MKKILFAVVLAVTVAAIGCGPSKEELRKKFVADSTKKADSIAVVMKKAEEEAKKAAEEMMKKAQADSIAKAAEEAAKGAMKGGKKK
jgi:guanylate kinase